MLISSTNLKNSRDPVVIRLLSRLPGLTWIFLALDGAVIGNEDEALAMVLDAIHWCPHVSIGQSRACDGTTGDIFADAARNGYARFDALAIGG